MKLFIAFIACLILGGCKSTSSSENLADGAKETVSNIYQALPKECKNEMAKAAFDSSIAQIEGVKARCVAEKAVLEKDIQIRNLIIVVLIALGLALTYRKVKQSLFP